MNQLMTHDVHDNIYERPDYPVLLVISGPSGVGKDTVVRDILKKDPNFYFVVTATDRGMRDGEVEGVDYFFVSTEQFEEMIGNGDLLEHAVVHGDYKGVPKQQIIDAMASKRDVIMRVDPQGAATLRDVMPGAAFVFLMAESEEIRARRLRQRNTETNDAYELRMEIARNELSRINEFDYCVVNKDGQLEETVSQIMSIVTAERCRTNREPIIL